MSRSRSPVGSSIGRWPVAISASWAPMYDTPDYVDQAITAMVKFFAVL